jgi:antitoxin CcdA
MQINKPTDKYRVLDLSSTPENVSALEIQEQRRENWLAENREAIEAYNELVARDGVFSKGLRGF